MLLILFLLGVQSQHPITAISINQGAGTVTYNDGNQTVVQKGVFVTYANGSPLTIIAKTNEVFSGGFDK